MFEHLLEPGQVGKLKVKNRMKFASIGYEKQLAKAFRNKDYMKAIRVTEEQIGKDDEADLHYYTIARCYYFLGEYEKSVNYAQRSIKIEDEFANTHKIITLAYNKLGLNDKAYFHAKRAITLYDSEPPKLDKGTERFLDIVFGFLSIFPKFKNARIKVKKQIYKEIDSENEFYNWALRFVAAYENRQE